MPFDAEVSQTNTDKLILQRARDNAVRCWGGGGVKPFNTLCMAQCVWEVLGDYADAWTGDRIAQALGFHDKWDLYRWNDAAGRTQAEAVARFDEAIARLP